MDNVEIKAVAFDVDGTLISPSIWKDMHMLFGFSPEDDIRAYGAYLSGALSFKEFFLLMNAAYLRKQPLPKKHEVDVVLKTFQFLPGADDAVRTLSKKYPLALISSGFSGYVDFVGDALGVSHRYSHTVLTYAPNGDFAGVAFTSSETELQAKVVALNDFAAKVGVRPDEVAFVGDSINDLAVFTHTGKGVLVGEGTEELRHAAWQRVETIAQITDILS